LPRLGPGARWVRLLRSRPSLPPRLRHLWRPRTPSRRSLLLGQPPLSVRAVPCSILRFRLGQVAPGPPLVPAGRQARSHRRVPECLPAMTRPAPRRGSDRFSTSDHEMCPRPRASRCRPKTTPASPSQTQAERERPAPTLQTGPRRPRRRPQPPCATPTAVRRPHSQLSEVVRNNQSRESRAEAATVQAKGTLGHRDDADRT
jgi:hypothetical protein